MSPFEQEVLGFEISCLYVKFPYLTEFHIALVNTNSVSEEGKMAVLPDGGQFHSFVKFYFVDQELESINPL